MFNDLNKKNQIAAIKVIAGTVLVIILALVIDVLLLEVISARNGYRTAQVLLDQVVSYVERNERNEEEILTSLKEEYIQKAQAVAYILDQEGLDREDAQKLRDLAEMMEIDEIHLFDEKGRIFGGTNPEYYGYSFSTGEQISYFKAMLEDKSLTMCQDLTPNTAEGKSMMYAIAWNEGGTYMAQVGIEPVRLLNEMSKNKMGNVIDNIPHYNGVNIYIANAESGQVVAATNAQAADQIESFIKGIMQGPDLEDDYSCVLEIDGFRNYCKLCKREGLIIMSSYSTRSGLWGFVISIGIIFVYMCLAGIIVFFLFVRWLRIKQKQDEQFAVLNSMADIYYCLHLIDLKRDTFIQYKADGQVKKQVDIERKASIAMREVMEQANTDEYREAGLEFSDLSTLPDRMKGKKMISAEFIGRGTGWYEFSYITIEADEEKKPVKVINAVRVINDMKVREEKLIKASNTDELTGFYNRRAYEDDINGHNDFPAEEDYVYISIDVNGLKLVNDSLGHDAGDELLLAAAKCMKQCIGPYGKLYRIGGDEFVAMIFCSEDQLKAILSDFDETLASWKGKLVENVTVSYGYVLQREGITSVREMAILADRRMYDAKSRHYRRRGMDRRGQKDAHVALCALYTKILSINLAEDSYQIINARADELTESMGYSDKLSQWLKSFALSGQVHPEDREEYLKQTDIENLRDYFKNNKKSLYIHYRRRYEDGYRRVVMEILPSEGYTDSDPILYLYVKDIEN